MVCSATPKSIDALNTIPPSVKHLDAYLYIYYLYHLIVSYYLYVN